MNNNKELKALKKLQEKNIKFPYELKIKNKEWTTIFTLSNKREILSKIKTLENANKNIYRCFFCNKFFKENKGGRFLPMDKRESGDNGFGFTFCCKKCVSEQYSRL